MCHSINIIVCEVENLLAWEKFGYFGNRCIEVVWAYALTHVATIYLAVEVEFFRQFATIFNGEI